MQTCTIVTGQQMIRICCFNRIRQIIGINLFFEYSMQKVQVLQSQRHSELHLLTMFIFGKFQKQVRKDKLNTILLLIFLSKKKTKTAQLFRITATFHVGLMLTVCKTDFHVEFLFLILIGKS